MNYMNCFKEDFNKSYKKLYDALNYNSEDVYCAVIGGICNKLWNEILYNEHTIECYPDINKNNGDINIILDKAGLRSKDAIMIPIINEKKDLKCVELPEEKFRKLGIMNAERIINFLNGAFANSHYILTK